MSRQRHIRQTPPEANLLKTLLLGAVASVGGWIAYSAYGINHQVPLVPAINAPRERIVGPSSGALNVYADREAQGRPLVLIHSINAAASSYEMRPIFEHYRTRRPVYALDLPGFGFSERADRVYSPELYKSAILDLMQTTVKEPADVVALSLGSEFAALAAVEQPEWFHSLTMISPSGFTSREEKRASQKAREDGTSSGFYRGLSFPLWSQAFYDLLTTRAGIRWFLDKSFTGATDASLVEYDYMTAHQPGARFAPLYFVSGQLFTPDVRQRVYERLSLPVLVLYDRDFYVRFDTLPEMLANRSNWRAERIMPTLGLPQFEQMDETAKVMDAFWMEVERV